MNKEEVLRMRLTASEKEGFSKAAELSGIGISSWARQKLRSAAIKELQDAGKKVPFLSPVKKSKGG